MAMQTLQLQRLLVGEGVAVDLVATNTPCTFSLIERIRGLRAIFRLFPYVFKVWRLCGRVDVVHVMANSGWSWQLFSAPVLWLGWMRNTPVIVNYRGGEAREYLQKSRSTVMPSLTKAGRVVVPSGFLEEVFGEFGVSVEVIPNIIDLDTFQPSNSEDGNNQFQIVITRNLEPIYGIDTAIRCIANLRKHIPHLVLKIAGSGPQLSELEALARELEVEECVVFLGRLDRPEIVALYQESDVMLNPTLVDNMPNSVLEALACGIPVVSTNVGGVPHLVEHEKTALLVPPQSIDEMAAALKRVYTEAPLRSNLSSAGLEMVKQFSWSEVGQQWIGLYQSQAVSA